jgi:hypothetical protein
MGVGGEREGASDLLGCSVGEREGGRGGWVGDGGTAGSKCTCTLQEGCV